MTVAPHVACLVAIIIVVIVKGMVTMFTGAAGRMVHHLGMLGLHVVQPLHAIVLVLRLTVCTPAPPRQPGSSRGNTCMVTHGASNRTPLC